MGVGQKGGSKGLKLDGLSPWEPILSETVSVPREDPALSPDDRYVDNQIGNRSVGTSSEGRYRLIPRGYRSPFERTNDRDVVVTRDQKRGRT